MDRHIVFVIRTGFFAQGRVSRSEPRAARPRRPRSRFRADSANAPEAFASVQSAYASMLQMSAVIGLHQLASHASHSWRRPQFRWTARRGQVIFVLLSVFFGRNLAGRLCRSSGVVRFPPYFPGSGRVSDVCKWVGIPAILKRCWSEIGLSGSDFPPTKVMPHL